MLFYMIIYSYRQYLLKPYLAVLIYYYRMVISTHLAPKIEEWPDQKHYK